MNTKYPDRNRSVATRFVQRIFPTILHKRAVCPDDTCAVGGSVVGIIFHLNDDHLWTRESIADWVDDLNVPRYVSDRTPRRTP